MGLFTHTVIFYFKWLPIVQVDSNCLSVLIHCITGRQVLVSVVQNRVGFHSLVPGSCLFGQCNSVKLHLSNVQQELRVKSCSQAAAACLLVRVSSSTVPSLAPSLLRLCGNGTCLQLLHILDTFKITKWTTGRELTFVAISLLYSWPIALIHLCKPYTFENYQNKKVGIWTQEGTQWRFSLK